MLGKKKREVLGGPEDPPGSCISVRVLMRNTLLNQG